MCNWQSKHWVRLKWGINYVKNFYVLKMCIQFLWNFVSPNTQLIHKQKRFYMEEAKKERLLGSPALSLTSWRFCWLLLVILLRKKWFPHTLAFSHPNQRASSWVIRCVTPSSKSSLIFVAFYFLMKNIVKILTHLGAIRPWLQCRFPFQSDRWLVRRTGWWDPVVLSRLMMKSEVQSSRVIDQSRWENTPVLKAKCGSLTAKWGRTPIFFTSQSQ